MLNYSITKLLRRTLRCVPVVALLLARPTAAQTADTVRADTAVVTAPHAPPRADSAVLADSVHLVTRWLMANGAAETRARVVAKHVLEFARRRALDPLLVVGVIGVENAELKPRARSSAGARGVMQVMPSWKKDIRDCGNDMHDVRANICFGTAVLRIALDASKSVREALLRYNGCVKAPGCRIYATAVLGRVGNAMIATRQADTSAATAPKRVSMAEGGEVARER
jgi:soluble lytic murein transglycosylase-like protein